MTNLLDSTTKFLENLNTSNIHDIGNDKLTEMYYISLGCAEIDINEWLTGLAFGKYPHYTKAKKAIKITRELNPKWKRKK